jgi:hypothetical protein
MHLFCYDIHVIYLCFLQYQKQIDNLKAQLEELLRVRNTEAENLLERQKEQYETQLKGRSIFHSRSSVS